MVLCWRFLCLWLFSPFLCVLGAIIGFTLSVHVRSFQAHNGAFRVFLKVARFGKMPISGKLQIPLARAYKYITLQSTFVVFSIRYWSRLGFGIWVSVYGSPVYSVPPYTLLASLVLLVRFAHCRIDRYMKLKRKTCDKKKNLR